MKRSNTRLLLIFTITLVAMSIMAANVFVVTVGKKHLYSGTDLEPYVNSVSYINKTIFANRGLILDANGMVVAQDEDVYNIICYTDENRLGLHNKPAYIEDIAYASRVLATILETDELSIYEHLANAKEKGLYQTEIGNVGRNLSKEQKEAIEEYDIPGIEFVKSNKRYYPLGDYFAPYLVGFAQPNEDGKLIGKMGVESYLNDELSGIDGHRIYQADKYGYILPGMKETVQEATNGYNVYLTLDSTIQDALETSMKKTIETRGATRVWGSVMEIDTGKILAWGQSPSFDPNKMNIEDYNNFGSQMVYEPGSVFKGFTYAAAMDSGNYDGNATVDSGPFCFVSNGKDPVRTYNDKNYGCITNSEYKNYGYIPYDYGLILSSNTVTSSLITNVISPATYREYLDKFKLFEPVKTDGIIENVGSIIYDQPVEKLTATYGHGLNVTMLELMQAYTAIFGNGEMVKPYYIDKIVDSYDPNKVIYEGTRTVVSRPIKETTAKQMQDLLARVVSDEHGTARFYAVEGMGVMAKTGTSQLAHDGTYDDGGRTITSVMIGFPYEKPKYIVYYAFVNDYDRNNHYYTEPVTDLIEKIALVTKLNATMDKSDEELNEMTTIEKHAMPNLVNHSLDYAYNVLNGYNVEVVKLGEGNKVIDQYPKKDYDIYTGQKIFLLTSEDYEFALPDLTGWTRKEVTQLWQLSGIAFKLDGYGIVCEQSIPPGQIVNRDTIVEVKLADIPSPDDKSASSEEETE